MSRKLVVGTAAMGGRHRSLAFQQYQGLGVRVSMVLEVLIKNMAAVGRRRLMNLAQIGQIPEVLRTDHRAKHHLVLA